MKAKLVKESLEEFIDKDNNSENIDEELNIDKNPVALRKLQKMFEIEVDEKEQEEFQSALKEVYEMLVSKYPQLDEESDEVVK